MITHADDQVLMYEGDGFTRRGPYPASHPAIDRFLALVGAPEAILRALAPAGKPAAVPGIRLKDKALSHG